MLCWLLISSCSTMEFNTSGREPFSVGARSGSERIVEVVVTKDFYFWGLSPGKEKAYLDMQVEIEGKGVSNPSFASIEQTFSFENIFYTIVTLGLYSPVDYKVSLLSEGETK
jgi:hypothetical protein